MPSEKGSSSASAEDDAPGIEVQRRFGANFRAIRKEQGLTQVQIADTLGMAQNQISAVEQGAENLTIRQMHRLAGAIMHDVSILLTPRRRK